MPSDAAHASTLPPVSDPEVRIALDAAIHAANLDRFARDCADTLRKQRSSWRTVQLVATELYMPTLGAVADAAIREIDALISPVAK